MSELVAVVAREFEGGGFGVDRFEHFPYHYLHCCAVSVQVRNVSWAYVISLTSKKFKIIKIAFDKTNNQSFYGTEKP